MAETKLTALAKLEKLKAQAEKVGQQLYGFGEEVRFQLLSVDERIDAARAAVNELSDDFKPVRRPRGAHVVAGRIYSIRDTARRHYAALHADTEAALVEHVEDGQARAVFTDEEGREIRALVKLSHFGPGAK